MPRDDPLRHPPPAYVLDHSTTLNPVVESWLDTLPPLTTKPSRRDIKQWRRARGGDSSTQKTCFIFSIVIRAISTLVATVAWSLNVAVFVESRTYLWSTLPGRMVAVLVVVRFCPRRKQGQRAVALTALSLKGTSYHRLERSGVHHDLYPQIERVTRRVPCLG